MLKEVLQMPGGDRRGPAGMGPMTGRAAGYCAGYSVPGFVNPVYGVGWGYGRGGGFGRGWGFGGGGHGWRNMFYATGLTGWQRSGYPYYGGAAYGYAPYYPPSVPGYSRESELTALKGQAEYMEDTLEGINKRIKELEEKKGN